MELALTVANQILIMFLLMGVGVALYKLKFFSDQTVKDLNNFVVVVVVMAAVIDPFTTSEYSTERMKNLCVTLVLAILYNIVVIFLSNIIYTKKNMEAKISLLSTVYPNSGFMAFPLLSAVFPSEGLFYGAIYIAVFNVFVWIHLVPLLSDEPKQNLKQFFKIISKNPVIIAVVASICMYALKIKLPEPISVTVGYVAGLNTPLAMILLGVFVSKTNILKAFTNLKVYKVCFAKLFVMPMLFLGAMKAISLVFPIEPMVATCLLISTGAPTAGIVSIMCERFGIDTDYSIQIMTLCTLLSIISLPIVVYCAQIVM
ncbi:MAG: AEC family transporter [Clostridia bacterium]